MFDPNMMNMMTDMMKNPETMQKMEEMMKNPDFMSNAMNMMKDQNMSSLFGNLPSQKTDATENDTTENDTTETETTETETNLFSENDVITLVNLSSELYNNKECVIKSFNNSTQRYNVYVKSLEKIISVKEINIELLKENIIEID